MPGPPWLVSQTHSWTSARGIATRFEPRRLSRLPIIFRETAAALGVAALKQRQMNDSSHNIIAGKYLISPLVKLLENGWYAASVSIRSGSGSGTHDRVLRLTRLFRSKLAAVQYATAEGLQWIGHRPSLASTGALAL